MADLDDSIRVAEQELNTTAEPHPNAVGRLHHLRIRLSTRYSRTGAIADLEESIRLARRVVDMTPRDQQHWVARLNGLGNRIDDRYSRTGKIDDLEESIQIGRRVIDAAPKSDPNYAMYLNDLGAPLYNRYLRRGAIADLEEATRITEQAVDMTPDHHPKWAMYLSNLGNYLHGRYSRIGAITDLEESIRLTRQAVNATPRYSPDWAGRLHNLGIRLSNRYSRIGAIADLEESIEFARQAVDATPEDHPNRAMYLDNLGAGLGDRYARTGAIADRDEAIRLARQALNTTSRDDTSWAHRLGNLGVILQVSYLKTREIADLEESIQVMRQAVDAIPEDHPSRAGLSMILVRSLVKKRPATQDVVTEITTQLQSILRQHNAPIITRIEAARVIAPVYARKLNWERAYDASHLAVSLVPKLTSRSLRNSDKQHALRTAVGIASDAAALALQAGKGSLAALRCLEQGRAVLATSLQEMRIDIQSLHNRYPALAEQFIQLRNELELSNTQDTSFLGQSSWKAQGSRRYNVGNELDKVIIEIRKQPGFEDFLNSPSEREMQAAAVSGPIIVINVSNYRCDAVVVEEHQIRVLALPQLNTKEIKERAHSLGSPATLDWLWDVAANPILDALGFVQPPSAENWPHVWWIPTGQLSKFPLHAAGRHRSGSTETVLDRVMSSYSPSIKAIIQGRSCRITADLAKAILIAMQDTPEHSRLDFAVEEVAMLRDIFKATGFNSIEPRRCKQDVIQHLSDCKIFHFAGHGYTDNTDPSHSYMLLEDWKTDPLTVATLLEMNLTERPPFLAYLSACGTGQIKSERFLDESIHLISAYQLAGFRHAIGTLWEVNDELCVNIARITYEIMRDRGMTDDSVCRGLHKAIREARDTWADTLKKERDGRRSIGKTDVSLAADEETIRSDRDLEKDRLARDVVLCDDNEDEGIEPLLWVPYVHYGV